MRTPLLRIRADRRRHARVGRTTILVTDADETLAGVASQLESEGFDTVVPKDASQVVELALSGVQGVIVNVSPPESDGWSIIQELKRDPRTRSIPILVWTDAEPDEARLRARRSDCDVLPHKPTPPADTARILRDVIYRRSRSSAGAE